MNHTSIAKSEVASSCIYCTWSCCHNFLSA